MDNPSLLFWGVHKAASQEKIVKRELQSPYQQSISGSAPALPLSPARETKQTWAGTRGWNKGSGSVASVLTGAGLGAAPVHVGMFSSFLLLSVGGICSLRALGAECVLHLSALSTAKICC